MSNELSKLEAALADIDLQIALSVDYIPVQHWKESWRGVLLPVMSPRLCVMKSDCLKYIAVVRTNQMRP